MGCWGDSSVGELGYSNTNTIGDNELPSTAGTVSIGARTVVQIAAGNSHTCTLFLDGTVMCWGDGADGRLGYNNTSDIGDNETPNSIGTVNLGGAVISQIVTGGSHTCVLTDTGSVMWLGGQQCRPAWIWQHQRHRRQ